MERAAKREGGAGDSRALVQALDSQDEQTVYPIHGEQDGGGAA